MHHSSIKHDLFTSIKVTKNLILESLMAMKILNVFVGYKAVKRFIKGKSLQKCCGKKEFLIKILQQKCQNVLKQDPEFKNKLHLEDNISKHFSHAKC